MGLDPARGTVTDERPPRRRRYGHRRSSIRPLHVVGLLLLGWLVWAMTTPGGVSARIEDSSDTIRGWLWDATTDPGLKRAANYYNTRFRAEGSYPQMTAEEIREDPNAGWGIGVEVNWCSNQAIVLQSLTGHGTISRLLVAGQDLGDVEGEVGCPTDLANPTPWQYHSEE
jgi:hypothetical protein